MSKYQFTESEIYLTGTDIPRNRLGIETPDLLHEVEATLLQQAYTRFITLTEFLGSMLKGSAPLQMLKRSIPTVRGEHVEPHTNTTGEALWREMEKLALDYLKERLPKLPTALTSDAWLGVGVK